MNEKRINFMADKTTYGQFKEFCTRNGITVSKCLRRLLIWAPIFLTSPEYEEFRKRIAEETSGRVLLWEHK